MDRLRHEVQHGDVPGRGEASGVLHDVRHREALVEHAQLAVRCVRGRRVDEDAAVLDGPVDVGHHRPDVSVSNKNSFG